jgi:hypothetical protein
MKRLTYYILLVIVAIFARIALSQVTEKPKPTFSLSIEEDMGATRINPDLHRVLVKLTRTAVGAEVEQFHEEAKGMYDMIVLRDGVPVEETGAMIDLREYRKVDRNPTISHPRLLESGENWTTPLDVSDYYDMTKPGVYQITVTRESLPLHLAYSMQVRSNTITVHVPLRIGGPSPPVAEKPRPRFALRLSAEDSDDVPPQSLQVVLENTSNSVIRERKCWPFMGMYNVVVSRNGEPVEEFDGARSLQMRWANVVCPGNETLLQIKPGVSYADRVPLSSPYVDKPGSYVVYVTRETYPYNPAKSVLVESNPIGFVVPEPSPANDTPPAPQ